MSHVQISASRAPRPAFVPFAPTEPSRRFAQRPSAAELVNRPDLADGVVIAAIREHLAFEGRTGPEPEVVVEAARLGKRKALAFLRKLVLPAPRVRLAMPIQPILRAHWAAASKTAPAPGAVPAR